MKIWNKITNEPWATTSDTLENIINIAQRQNANPAAIAAQLGRKLQNTYAVSIRNNVAIIPIRGPLFRYANIFTAISGATSYELLARDFNSALVDESVKAILFDIDSPGGEVNGCSELADMIYNARGKKPIIAYASGNCCSGAYWIAAACDEIVVTDTAVVGSIGVVAVYEREDDKNKIEIVSSQSPLKRINPDTPEGQSKLQARLDTLAEVFINKIATYRDTSTETVIKDFGQGDVFIGRKAIWQGLANRQSSFERILTDLNKEKEDDDMNENDIKQRERQRIKEVLDSELFRNNPYVQKYLDYRRGTNSTLNIDPIILGNEKARFVGNIGDFEVWVYNDIYIEGDTEKKILPENTVLLGSRGGVEGVRCYGAIKDEQANFQANRYFPKSWLENDPAVRWMLLQSAPLVVPYRPNATMCVTVK